MECRKNLVRIRKTLAVAPQLTAFRNTLTDRHLTLRECVLTVSLQQITTGIRAGFRARKTCAVGIGRID